ncbi:MAG: cysteine dioxygenase family protein [Nannocystaceae bacterium]|nr:cysteine dioxygenase family protein [Nannocystaceae bacterium]
MLALQEQLKRWHQLQRTPGVDALEAMLEDVSAVVRPEMAVGDPDRAYGRTVLLAAPGLEIMLARWTPGISCAPHDHGGARGTVCVLQGHATHRVWEFVSGRLRCTSTQGIATGERIRCGRRLIHSMEQGEGVEALVTLHLYAPAIETMTVYDTRLGTSIVVEGSSGAWIS